MTIHLQVGVAPWLGNSHAKVMEELHFHDLPLLGVSELDGQKLLFRCVIGEAEHVNVWTYTPLTDDDLTAIDSADEANIDDIVLPISHQSTAVAVALDGYGIVAWTEWADFDTQQAAIDALADRMAKFIQSITEGAQAARVQADRILANA